MMWNHKTEIRGRWKDEGVLEMAVMLAFVNVPGKLITHTNERDGYLELLWRAPTMREDGAALPFPHHSGTTKNLIRGWLESRSEGDFYEHPGDMDGIAKPEAFHLLAEEPHSHSDDFISFKVAPIWAHYPK